MGIALSVLEESEDRIDFQLTWGASITAQTYTVNRSDTTEQLNRVVECALADLDADMAKYPA